MKGRIALAGLALGLGACGEAAPPPLDVLVSGCAAVRADGVCEIPESRDLNVSIRTSPGARVTLEIGSESLTIASRGSGDRFLAVTVPEAARSIVVVAEEAGGEAMYRQRIDINVLAPCVRSKGDPSAVAALDAKTGDRDPLARAGALRCLARVERSAGRVDAAVQHIEAAIALEHAAGRLSEEVDDRLMLAFVLLLTRRDFDGTRAALAPLRALAAPHAEGAARVPYFEGLLARETGNVRDAAALFDEALAAAARLHLDGLRADVLSASTVTLRSAGRYAEATARAHEALMILPPGAPACEIAAKLGDLGWGILDTPEPRRSASDDPTGILELSLTLAQDAGCGADFMANALTNLAMAAAERGLWDDALALVEQARRAHPEAGARVAHAWPQIEAEALLARGRPGEALALYDDLAATARAHVLPSAEIDAAIGRGRALAALDRLAGAEAAFDDAEAAVDVAMRAVPLGGGRDTFTARHERVAISHIDVVLRRAFEEGYPRRAPGEATWTTEALTGPHVERAARIAAHSVGRELLPLRSAARLAAMRAPERAAMERALAGYLTERDRLDRLAMLALEMPLDQRAAAGGEIAAGEARLRGLLDRTLDRLPPELPEDGASVRAEPGEVILVLHPIASGWVGIAITREGASARRLDDRFDIGALAGSTRDPAIAERAAAALLEPFRAEIQGAARLRVIAYGPLARVPFHALPWDGAPLLAHVAVVVSAGLSSSQVIVPQPPRAIVVADELFPGATREIDAAAAGLARAGFVVERLQGDGASAPAVRAALSRPDVALVHLAGHATHGGIDGLESAITLARGSAITSGDVLALPHVPPLVVLSACDTSTVSDDARAAGLGLAQAFLVAGARTVVASTSEVDDDAASTLLGALYDGGTFRAASPDLVMALDHAQRAQLGGPGAGTIAGRRPAWPSYRALVP